MVSDTALAAYLALPGQRSFDLGDLAVRYLQRELKDAAEPEGQLTLDGLGPSEADVAAEAAHADVLKAVAVNDLSDALETVLGQKGGDPLLGGIELPLTRVLAAMEYRGIAADLDFLHELQKEFAAGSPRPPRRPTPSSARRSTSARPSSCRRCSSTSSGLPKTKKNKTGYTTDADALTSLLASTGHPFLEHLLRHRDVTRLRTVIDGLIPMVDDVGRVHTTYQQTIAATGRLSSTDPNLQNIPIRSAEGRRIRQAFVVGAGYESLMTADYSQIEMRIMAHLSEDAGLIEAFTSGEDLHSFVASRAFGIPIERGRPGDAPPDQGDELRPGLRAQRLRAVASSCTSPPRRRAGQMHAYFERFGGIRDYLDGVVDDARQTGYTETTLGRRRYLPDLTSDNRQRREMAERMALNAPIQGSAADVIKVAMLNVEKAIEAEGLRSRMLLQVHDELVLEVAPGEQRRAGGAGPPRDGRRRAAVGAAGGLGRLRQQLGRRRALSRTGALRWRRDRRRAARRGRLSRAGCGGAGAGDRAVLGGPPGPGPGARALGGPGDRRPGRAPGPAVRLGHLLLRPAGGALRARCPGRGGGDRLRRPPRRYPGLVRDLGRDGAGGRQPGRAVPGRPTPTWCPSPRTSRTPQRRPSASRRSPPGWR